MKTLRFIAIFSLILPLSSALAALSYTIQLELSNELGDFVYGGAPSIYRVVVSPFTARVSGADLLFAQKLELNLAVNGLNKKITSDDFRINRVYLESGHSEFGEPPATTDFVLADEGLSGGVLKYKFIYQSPFRIRAIEDEYSVVVDAYLNGKDVNFINGTLAVSHESNGKLQTRILTLDQRRLIPYNVPHDFTVAEKDYSTSGFEYGQKDLPVTKLTVLSGGLEDVVLSKFDFSLESKSVDVGRYFDYQANVYRGANLIGSLIFSPEGIGASTYSMYFREPVIVTENGSVDLLVTVDMHYDEDSGTNGKIPNFKIKFNSGYGIGLKMGQIVNGVVK